MGERLNLPSGDSPDRLPLLFRVSCPEAAGSQQLGGASKSHGIAKPSECPVAAFPNMS